MREKKKQHTQIHGCTAAFGTLWGAAVIFFIFFCLHLPSIHLFICLLYFLQQSDCGPTVDIKCVNNLSWTRTPFVQLSGHTNTRAHTVSLSDSLTHTNAHISAVISHFHVSETNATRMNDPPPPLPSLFLLHAHTRHIMHEVMSCLRSLFLPHTTRTIYPTSALFSELDSSYV